jgi:hypothetical protein
MHEEYDYDDEEHDYDNAKDPYKHYFKFDPAAWDAWGKWLQDALNDIVESSPNVWYIQGFPSKSFPVNSYFSSTGKDKTFQYLGNNYQGSQIWKKKYFILDPINIEYKKHIESHASYFLHQPSYYKGLFDILN